MRMSKFSIPPLRPGDLLTRQPLLDGLNQGLHCKLTTVIAPSGYGKTTCLSQWAAQCPYPVAWLSLDRLDNDQERFWSHLVTALRQAFPSSGEATTAYLAASEAHRTERLELALLRDLQAVGQPFVLLLDDLQVIDLAPIFDTIAYLLDYLPDHAHLYAASRGTLPLKLARLRAKGQLCRLEVGDLRLRPQEGVRYLSDRLNVPLGRTSWRCWSSVPRAGSAAFIWRCSPFGRAAIRLASCRASAAGSATLRDI